MEASKTIADFADGLPRPAVLCTIVQITGSAPREAGTKMWVTMGRSFGTVGGGAFEFQVLQHCRRLLQSSPAAPHLKEYALCKEMGQCCGGRVQVFFEMVSQKKAAHLFGGGHVGRAVSQVLSQMPFQVILIDPRPEWSSAEGLPPDLQVRCIEPMVYAQSRAWTKEDAVCIFTHSHDLDFLLVKHFLSQPMGYLGLIGSEHKAKVFQARLRSESEELQAFWEEKMHCPIGTPLASKNPKVIAVSIATELLKEWGLK